MPLVLQVVLTFRLSSMPTAQTTVGVAFNNMGQGVVRTATQLSLQLQRAHFLPILEVPLSNQEANYIVFSRDLGSGSAAFITYATHLLLVSCTGKARM